MTTAKVVGVSARVEGIETSCKVKFETADGRVQEQPVSVSFYLSVNLGDMIWLERHNWGLNE